MSDFTWPDEAVEAVAEALGVVGREYANALPEDAGAYEEESVSAVLAALAPFVSAMLDEARDAEFRDDAHRARADRRELDAAGRRLAEAVEAMFDEDGVLRSYEDVASTARAALAEYRGKEER